MISKKMFAEKIREYDDLKSRYAELKAQMDDLENEMKSELERRGVSEVEVGNRVVRWTPYVSQRFDSTAFRKAEPETYAAYTKEVKGHRFSVA